MGSTKKPTKSKFVSEGNVPGATGTISSSYAAGLGSQKPAPSLPSDSSVQVAGKKRPSTFEDWVAQPDEEQYDYRAFRPRYLSKKQKKELRKQHIAPKITTQTTIYELKHPSLAYLDFAQSDMALVLNEKWQNQIGRAHV